MKLRSLVLTLAALTAGACAITARAADASAPRGTTLNVYDSGFGLISEEHIRSLPRPDAFPNLATTTDDEPGTA